MTQGALFWTGLEQATDIANTRARVKKVATRYQHQRDNQDDQ